MEIYKSTDRGVTLSPEELAALNLNAAGLISFFQIEDINSLLNVPDSVGIRVYEARQNAGLVAAAVDGSGFDIGDSFLFSDKNVTIKADEHSRRTAEFIVKDNRRLTAFFSRTMLEGLLGTVPATDRGIGFFRVSMNNLVDDHFPTMAMKSIKGGLFTFIALAALIDEAGNMVMPTDFNNPVEHVLSNFPCPGYCVSATVSISSAVVPNTTDEGNQLRSEPYLRPWS